MPGGSKKGAPFEREICRDLSLWYSLRTRDDLFWRTSTSGGRATTRHKKQLTTTGHYGDIAATCAEGAELLRLTTLELKRGYSKHTWQDVLDSNKKEPLYYAWIEQAMQSAKQARTPYWWLITRRDQHQSLLTTPLSFLLSVLNNASSIALAYATFPHPTYPRKRVAVLRLEDWWGVPPKYVRTLLPSK